MLEMLVIGEINEFDEYNTIFDNRFDGVEILKFRFFNIAKFLAFFK